MQKRNHMIDLLKFIFSLVIMLRHSEMMFQGDLKYKHIPFLGGSRAVEFFFIVSGYLIAAACLNRKYGNAMEYMWHKIKPFLLPVWISWLVSFIGIHAISENVDIQTILSDALYSIFDLLFLRNAGFRGISYIGTSWYISALMLSTLLICVPLMRYRETYVFWLAPVSAIMILGHLSHECGHIVDIDQWMGIAYKCQLRAFAEINLGIFLYGVCLYLKKVNFTGLGRCLLGCIEMAGYGIATAYMLYEYNTYKYDFEMVILLSVSILITFSEKTFSCLIGEKAPEIFGWLGKYSLYIYLDQKVIYNIVPYFFGDKTYWEMIVLYAAGVMLTALFVMKCVELIRDHALPAVKGLLIES